MSQQVTITSVTANTPVDISYCYANSGSPVYVATVSTFPYVFDVPDPYDLADFLVVIDDTQGCLYSQEVYITPTPTPSITPSQTITPTVTTTPTNTPTPTSTPLPPSFNCEDVPTIPSGEKGKYLTNFNVGNDPTDLGAVIIYFNPQTAPDGIRVLHNGNYYNRLFSPKPSIFTPLESTNGSTSYTTVDGNAPSVGSGVPIEYDSFILGLDAGGNDAWLPNGVETVTYNNGDYQSGGDNVFNLMVIPKTNAQSSLLTVENMGWSGAGNTVFSLIVNCPTELPSFLAASGSTFCGGPKGLTYYFARFRNQTNTYPERNNPIFSDPNGENPINDTPFALNISMDNGDVIQVKRGMVIGVPTGCT